MRATKKQSKRLVPEILTTSSANDSDYIAFADRSSQTGAVERRFSERNRADGRKGMRCIQTQNKQERAPNCWRQLFHLATATTTLFNRVLYSTHRILG